MRNMNTMPAMMPANTMQRDRPCLDRARDHADVAAAQALEAALEPAEEAFLLAVVGA